VDGISDMVECGRGLLFVVYMILLHLVGFFLYIIYDARSHEHQKSYNN
jgi:hypothetical protein